MERGLDFLFRYMFDSLIRMPLHRFTPRGYSSFSGSRLRAAPRDRNRLDLPLWSVVGELILPHASEHAPNTGDAEQTQRRDARGDKEMPEETKRRRSSEERRMNTSNSDHDTNRNARNCEDEFCFSPSASECCGASRLLSLDGYEWEVSPSEMFMERPLDLFQSVFIFQWQN